LGRQFHTGNSGVEMSYDKAIDEIKLSIRTMNEDYSELVKTVSYLRAAISELRAEVKWIKALLVPVAIGSLVAAIKVLMG
jgi:hypothetical protein